MLSRIAISQTRKANITCAAIRSLSSAGPNVDIESFRGEWKTYGDVSNFEPGKFVVQTFNKISPIGLKQFGDDLYDVKAGDGEEKAGNPHAILLRSHKLQEEEVPLTVRAIAR